MNNNVTIAPQVVDSHSLYLAWKASHIGRHSDFVRFMTTPSGERSRFLMAMQITGSLRGSLLFNQVTTPSCPSR